MRKTPQQQRSIARVDHILASAEHLFATVGYDAATTNSIAQHAGVSIGSLYQFFPNKEALRDALVERYIAQMREDYQSDALTNAPVSALIRGLINSTVSIAEANIGFQTLFLSDHAPVQMHALIVGVIERMLTERFGNQGLKAARAREIAEMGVAIVKGAMAVGAVSDILSEQQLLAETHIAIFAYLRTSLLNENITPPADIA